ncbi:MAG: sulfite exporter TauE/SafE family protein, partial [Halobacteria archaeon]|nr:sulfite exporter TauE/SafE family protein [Halobacteria archaeon]
RGPRIVGLGAAHGFLPCPILYPAFLYSFARGSALDGFLSLAALGLGTFPAVFVYGTLVQSASVESRRKLHRVLGAVLILLGYIPISMGLNLLGVEVPRLMPPFYQPLS